MSPAYLAERRAHVLAAAARCFAREGFHRTTMQHIVREAGLSPGSPLPLLRVEGRHRRGHRGRAPPGGARAVPAGAGGDGLMALASAFLGRLDRPGEREWRRVTVQPWGEALRNLRVMEVVRSGLDEPLRRLTALLRAGQRDGRLPRDLDAAATARVAAAVFEGWCCSRRGSRSWTCRASCGRRSACWKGSPARAAAARATTPRTRASCAALTRRWWPEPAGQNRVALHAVAPVRGQEVARCCSSRRPPRPRAASACAPSRSPPWRWPRPPGRRGCPARTSGRS